VAWYVLRRLLGAIPLLLITSFIVFSFLHIAPGSPEQVLLAGKNVDQETLQAIRDRYQLDDPFLVQYWTWLKNVLNGDLGESIIFHDDVVDVVAPRILPTVELALYALVLIVLIGLPLGILAGIKRNSPTDTAVSSVTLVGSAISPYVSGILLIAVFAVALGWFPVFGLGGSGLDRIYHLTLPAIALAIALQCLVTRTTRASLGSTLQQEFVETARSRGFSERRVVGKHALRSALIPVLTITGLVFGFLISGAVLVEYTFGLNGLGALLIQAVRTKDFPVVQAVTLLFTVTFILINLAVDLLYAVADPRVRLQRKAT
jgi:peptide/nickel transport system permease protein